MPPLQRGAAGTRGPRGMPSTAPARGRPAGLVVGRLRGQGSLCRGMSRRDGQAQHVAQHPGIPLRRGAADGEDLRCQDRFRADHPAQRGQRAGMHPMREPLHDEPVHVATGEADPHARARHGLLAKLGRDGILEGPVQMGQPAVDDDRRDRSLRPGGAGRRLCHPSNLATPPDSRWRDAQRCSMTAPCPRDRASGHRGSPTGTPAPGPARRRRRRTPRGCRAGRRRAGAARRPAPSALPAGGQSR